MRSFLKKLLPPFARYRLRNTEILLLSLLQCFSFGKFSYSQCGEDLIVKFLLERIAGPRVINYLDIGAHHPFYLSNTALLYKYGATGLLVEPDPFCSGLLKTFRRRDTVITASVASTSGLFASLYVMDPPTLNTFSESEMHRYVELGHRLVRVIKSDLIGVNALLARFNQLDFLNIDIEGLDFDVVRSIDFSLIRPVCICIETSNYSLNSRPSKTAKIHSFLESKGYFPYADTFINTIFVDIAAWNKSFV